MHLKNNLPKILYGNNANIFLKQLQYFFEPLEPLGNVLECQIFYVLECQIFAEQTQTLAN